MSVEATAAVWRYCRQLPPHLKVVLLRLADFANKEGCAWPSQGTLAEDCGKSRRQIAYDLDELKALGQIEPAGTGPRGAVIYRVVAASRANAALSAEAADNCPSDATPAMDCIGEETPPDDLCNPAQPPLQPIAEDPMQPIADDPLDNPQGIQDGRARDVDLDRPPPEPSLVKRAMTLHGRLCELLGIAEPPNGFGLGGIRELETWLAMGASTELIETVVGEIAARRRKAEAGWLPRGWGYFDREVRARLQAEVATDKAEVEAMDPERARWRRRLERWTVSGFWLDDWGPPPDQPGCKAPSDLRAELVQDTPDGRAAK